ncbi:unnamed protein product [Closterium sp. Naga37s-1]|nr:unnamed protein product [Closterium sp. Naga37s-1]
MLFRKSGRPLGDRQLDGFVPPVFVGLSFAQSLVLSHLFLPALSLRLSMRLCMCVVWDDGRGEWGGGGKESMKLHISRVNDDFCDCPDGTDEPGTSACPNASFFCRNRGHNPLSLFSSRVNDGICDCCDGSDEYDGRVTCANTCAQAGAARRQQLAADVAKHREGVRQRQRAVEEWREKKVRLQEERGRLEDEEKELQEKEKVLKAPASSPPSLWDKAKQVWSRVSSLVSSPPLKLHPSSFPPPCSCSPPSAPASSSPPSLWDKAKQVWSRVSSLVSAKPSLPVNETDLLTIRSEYNVISSQLSKTKGRLRTVKEKLEKDLGPDGEFASFADHCFSFKVNQYEYEVCPYRQVKQKEKHQSDTTVGRWSGFEDNYRTMMFKNGDKCWNGPNRSIKVKLECGLKTGIKSVEEPSRCEYEAVLVTTAVCNAELAQELERQLKEMEDDLAGHDEL